MTVKVELHLVGIGWAPSLVRVTVCCDHVMLSVTRRPLALLVYLKDGQLMSTKYESVERMFKPPHVIYIANQHPDYTKWTAGRFNVIDA